EHHVGQTPMPEVQGAVAAVDLVGRTILLVPRGNAPLHIGGQFLAELRVRVTEGTVLVRQESGERTPIGPEGIAAGRDRAWVRGVPATPSSFEATQVRVRDDAH